MHTHMTIEMLEEAIDHFQHLAHSTECEGCKDIYERQAAHYSELLVEQRTETIES